MKILDNTKISQDISRWIKAIGEICPPDSILCLGYPDLSTPGAICFSFTIKLPGNPNPDTLSLLPCFISDNQYISKFEVLLYFYEHVVQLNFVPTIDYNPLPFQPIISTPTQMSFARKTH